MKHTKSGRQTSRVLVGQIFLAISLANARNDPPPSSERPWSPPNLANYERNVRVEVVMIPWLALTSLLVILLIYFWCA